MPNTPVNLLAGGNINPCSFVKISGELTGVQCSTNELAVGVAQEGTDYPPLSDVTVSGYAARANESFRLYGLGDICLLTLGSGGCTANDMLKSDSSGYGVTATTGVATQNINARALMTGNAGEKVLVEVLTQRATG